ncbi:MAG: aminomethyl-transferring glycine dehydrogenase subunit GcvPB [Chloroflexi bacterium]|nr:aminomethyl-transferring glycine dehydrogenase subunit GcvPB [Chloroflexota bacterium]
MSESTIFDLSSPGRIGVRFPVSDVPQTKIPDNLLRKNLPLPELSEIDVIRHFTHLSTLNYCIDGGLYPLGSCTMKYNPKVNEETARLSGFTLTHPLQPEDTVQGNLALMYDLQEYLKEIAGFSAVSLEPAAGAQGEFVGVKIIRAFHRSHGDSKRTKILIPDSAHGTNPATSSMSGFEVIPVPSDLRGNVDLTELRKVCDDSIAGLMLTNPNTLGLFDENVLKVIEIVHKVGGLVYGDGANLNALLGIARPGDLGIDIMHFNLHKTFSTPHGGGGPGSGPVGVAAHLVDFLPSPLVAIIENESEDMPPLYGFITPKSTIGRVKSFFGQFGMFVRALTYIRMHGPEGLRKVSEYAVLNANYLLSKIDDTYTLPYKRTCMHEFVVEGCWPDIPDIHALDIAKRLMDYKFHPPTNYFPLIVHEALMIEPTETESKQSLDIFAETLITIAREARTNPQLLKDAPHDTPVGRLDEIKAAKDLVLCCWQPDSAI